MQCNFQKPQIKDFEYVDIPFDGSGFITPEYASYINKALKIKGATSFQIRLPFMKGMLHEVDVHEFLETYNNKKGEQWYEDAFGIKRDLSKAHIFVTESMFKGMKWILQYLDSASNKTTNMDPMVFYCDMMKKYDHALYISGTNLPYGHSKYTHLSYQMINTLHFTEEQFKRIVERHCFFIENPIEYLKDCEERTVDDDDNNIQEKDSDTQEYDEETIVARQIPNWKRALFKNSALKSDRYIKSQLKNVQKGLLTKLATGKLVVEGQNRYLCRDLLPLCFEEGLKQYKKKKETKSAQFFEYSKEISDRDKENNERFKLKCQGILNSYVFYVNTFLRVLKNEKKGTFYALKNLQTNLFEIYDEENVIDIQRKVLPRIQEKIEACLNQDNTIEKMKGRLNQKQWLLQPMQNREKALEQIIGNGFDAQSLKKEEQEVLFHFEQQGYKTLWNVLTLIEDPKVTLFETLKKRVEKNRTEIQELDKSLEKDLESIVQGFYEKNETDPKNKLYGVCLQKLKQIVTETKELPLELKIETLYEITKKSEDYGRFFWEVFEWKELESYIEEEKEDVE